MKNTVHVHCLLALAALVAGTVACDTSTPLQPSSTTSAGTATTSTTFSSTSPAAVSPNDNVQVAFATQPYTLVVNNAVTTATDPQTYTFEVATDAAFTNIVQTKADVAPGANGRTQVTLSNLPASSKFFWRARSVSGGEAGPAGRSRSFTIGAQVILQAPVLVSPAQNAQANGNAVLTVNNVQRTGPAGPISYKFELADSPSFSNIVFSATVPEQGSAGSQTSVAVTTRLTSDLNYTWRVQASDPQNFVTTAFSTAFTFRFVAFDLAQAVIHASPGDLASWPQTATITRVEFRPDAMIVDFDRRTGPNQWPQRVPPGWDGPLQYTLGMCMNRGGQWHCSAVVQFWTGRELEAAASPGSIAQTWFYDPVRWGPLSGYVPACGEVVGMFVAQGDLRGRSSAGDGNSIRERSNVQLVPFCGGFSLN